jgi:hypothetical protein
MAEVIYEKKKVLKSERGSHYMKLSRLILQALNSG